MWRAHSDEELQLQLPGTYHAHDAPSVGRGGERRSVGSATRVETGRMPRTTAGTPRRRPPNSPFHDAPARVLDVFEVDSRVVHDKHGIGRVVRVNGSRMDVRFAAGLVDVDTLSSRVSLL